MVTNTEEDRKVLPRQKKFIFYNIFGCGILMHEPLMKVMYLISYIETSKTLL